MKKKLSSLLATALALSLSSQAFALGTASYSAELISARSLGQGGTGVAGVQDDPVAVYTNPAAMALMKGTHATLGLSYINGRPKFTSGVTSAGGLGSQYALTGAGQVTGARATSVAIPNFAITHSLLDGSLAVGLAAVLPYGLETHFNGDSPIRYAATDARLRIVDITPAVAAAINDQWAVGGGFDLYDAFEGDLEHRVNTGAVNFKLAGGGGAGAAAYAASNDANSRLNGNGNGMGYHLGLTWKPSSRHQVGLVYHSNVAIRLNGTTQLTGLNNGGLPAGAAAVFGGTNFTTGAHAPLYIPQNLQLGYAFMPNPKTTLEVDAAWYDWHDARQLGITFDNLTATQSSILNASNPTIYNPRKTVNLGLGVNHQCTDKVQGRAGFYYQSSALPESTFSPSFMDLPRYAATFGVGWSFAPNWTLDGAYDAVFFHSRSINAPDANTAGGGYSGSFANMAHILAASVSYRM